MGIKSTQNLGIDSTLFLQCSYHIDIRKGAGIDLISIIIIIKSMGVGNTMVQ